MSLDFTEYEKEIDRLDRMADKLDSLGMGKSHKATVEDLRLRFELFKGLSRTLTLKQRKNHERRN